MPGHKVISEATTIIKGDKPDPRAQEGITVEKDVMEGVKARSKGEEAGISLDKQKDQLPSAPMTKDEQAQEMQEAPARILKP